MKNKKNIIAFILLITTLSFVFIYICYQTRITGVQNPFKHPIENKDNSGLEMNETETIRHLMTQIYKSDKFAPDDNDQLPSVFNKIVKNRLFWKPTDLDLVANPSWSETLNNKSEDSAPLGYFIASPLLFHTYNYNDSVYSIMFAQTATGGYGHISGSDIGVGVFKKENNKWNPVFISENINNGIGVNGDAGTLAPFLIGRNIYAYKNELINMAQGSISYHKDLYYFDGVKFNNILSLTTSGSDGTDCVSKGIDNEWGETVDITTEQINNSDFYDLILKWGGTKPERFGDECKVVLKEDRTERYHWDGKKYQLLK